MEKHRRQAVIISTIGVVMILFGVTYSFFNYTRTGVSNTIRVGRIYFNSEQTNTITLVDVFPIDKTLVNSSNDVGTATITIEGDTTYDDGVEYQLTVSNLTNTVGNKKIPIDVSISTNGIGDSDQDYFDNRGGNSPIYKVLTTGTIYNNKQLLVGYIPKGSNGVDGTVTIKAYLDKDKIAISDTYPASSHIDVEGEDIFEYNQHPSSSSINKCVSYIMSVGYDYYLQTGETIDSFCAGTGTIDGQNFQYWYENSWFTEEDIDYFKSINIFIQTSFATETGYIDNTTKEWANGRTVFTTDEWNSIHANGVSFQVKVEANEGIWASEPGDLQLKKAILAKEADTNVQCSNITYEEDNITYFSGTNECVDINYVWYSGKLWRITNIYPDGSMKLITEDMITSINWGSNAEYDGSWIYQWLNEDFYDTLVNPNNIIDSDIVWNYSNDENRPPSKPETLALQKTKLAPVGLLNAYEYYNSYRCVESETCASSTYSASYLNIGYHWWLITPAYESRVDNVYYDGSLYNSDSTSHAAGVRPSIVIKPGVGFTGNGTKTSPYKIVGDKEGAVNNTTLLSNRSIGEYVKFDNNLYRIVDTSNGITKLVSADYLKGPCENCDVNSGDVISKYLASSVYYGKEGNTTTDRYWDYYLNNTWYNNITPTYKNMLVDGTYYLGFYPDYSNYKSTLCKDNNLDSVTTKNCTKYTETDVDKIFTGKVGLLRVGEMFSSQVSPRTSSSQYIFMITPNSTWDVRSVSINGYLYTLNSTNSYAVRPSITLKPGIKITGGTGYVGGDTNSPFEISE